MALHPLTQPQQTPDDLFPFTTIAPRIFQLFLISGFNKMIENAVCSFADNTHFQYKVIHPSIPGHPGFMA